MRNRQKTFLVIVILNISIWTIAFGQETRTWLGQTNDWHEPANWLPFGVPGGQDDVILGDIVNPTRLNEMPTTGVDSLLITNGGRLFTDGGTLTVHDFGNTGWLRIVGSGSELIVESSSTPSADLASDAIQIESGGSLNMQGGDARIDNAISVDSSSRISGFGNIEILATDSLNPPTVVTVDGTIRAIGGPLVLLTEPDAVVDFSSANLDAAFGDLLLDISLADDFEGTMTIGDGQVVLVDGPFTFGSDSTLSLFGDDENNPALFLSESTGVNGRVNIDGAAVLSGSSTFRGSSEVSVPDFNDELRLTGSQSVVFGNLANPAQRGPSFIGNGRVINETSAGMLLINGPQFESTFVNRSTMNLFSVFFIATLEVGTAEFNNFAQTESGTLVYDIGQNGGQAVGDNYAVSGAAELAGRLCVRLVELNNSGLPELQLGDSFRVMSSGVGVFGKFDEVDFSHTPENAYWQTIYEPNITCSAT